MDDQKLKTIRRGVLSEIQKILYTYGITEAILIYPIVDGPAAQIFCNQMKQPGAKGLIQMEAVKAACENLLFTMQSGNGQA